MKATIDFDPELYRQLKAEAALRRRTVRDLVDEGVRHVLGTPRTREVRETSPPYAGSLHAYAANAGGAHDLATIRASIAQSRVRHEAK